MAKRSTEYVTSNENHNGLTVCHTYRDLVSADEYDAINWLCMAYNNNESIDSDIYEKATKAIKTVIATVRAGMA